MTTTVQPFERIIRKGNLETGYDASDFVNPTNYEPHPNGWPQGHQQAFVVLNGGYVLAIVFAEYYAYCEQDALDEAADSGKLDNLQCSEEELKDYEVGKDSEGNPEYEGIINLGNAGEPFASESLDIWVLDAQAFAEDPALMTPDRVLEYLADQQEQAEGLYEKVRADDPDWQALYLRRQAARDAYTLAWYTVRR